MARGRRWHSSEKAGIVAESYAPGASGMAVAVRRELHRNQIVAWRCEFLQQGGVLIDNAICRKPTKAYRRMSSSVGVAPCKRMEFSRL